VRIHELRRTDAPQAPDPRARKKDRRLLPWWRRRELSIECFAENQRTVRQWIALSEIADWCARSATGTSADNEETARTLAYQRLDQSARNGEFDRNERCRGPAMGAARSKILYLDPYVAGEPRTPRRCRLTQEQFRFVEEIRTLGARCWLPHHLARQWLAAHNYPWPAHFDPLKPVRQMSAVAPRKRGRKPTLRPMIAARMRAEIESGSVTREQLADMLEKEMEAKYQVSRDTARKARKDALG
jgi:hypothetical protein